MNLTLNSNVMTRKDSFSQEYLKEQIDYSLEQQNKIKKMISLVDEFFSIKKNEWKRSETPFLHKWASTSKARLILEFYQAFLKHLLTLPINSEFSDTVSGNSVFFVAFSYFQQKSKSVCFQNTKFLSLLGLLNSIPTSQAASAKLRTNSMILTQDRMDNAALQAKRRKYNETSYYSIPDINADLFRKLEERAKLIDRFGVRKSGLTVTYIYKVFGNRITSEIFPNFKKEDAETPQELRDNEAMRQMKKFVLGIIDQKGFCTLGDLHYFGQIGRTGRPIARGFNYSHWKIVQAEIISTGRFVYEKIGGFCIDLCLKDKEPQVQYNTISSLTKENGKIKCPSALLEKRTYLEYKLFCPTSRAIPPRHFNELKAFAKNSSLPDLLFNFLRISKNMPKNL